MAIFRAIRDHCSCKAWGIAAATEGAQIVEFAITLPLLVVIFVGIFDFGQAFNLKQKLSLAAREGARFASAQSTRDLTNSSPASVAAVRDVVDAYLRSNNINDCGLGSAAATQQGSNWTWTFTALGCSAGSFVLTVNRGFTFTTVSGGNTLTVEATRVTLQYPYRWQFSRVIKVAVPGANYAGTTQLPASAVMQNLD